jgi:glycine oxidase
MDCAEIVIVGGGIIGLTTAYFLAREGAQVAVLDRGDFGQEASWAGAGILPPSNAERARTPFDRLRALSVSMFPKVSAELREQTGIDNGYLRCGGLEVLDPAHAAAEEEWRGAGVSAQRLTALQVTALEPQVATTLGDVWHLPELAQLRNPRHLQALIAGCTAKVRLLPQCPVLAVEAGGRRVTGVRTPNGVFHAGQVLLAGGSWTDALLEPLGCRAGIVPVRGQIALLHMQPVPVHCVLLCGSRYVVPRPDGRILVGSTEEWVGYDKRTTAAAIGELLSFAIKLVPVLGGAALERSWAGLRPGSRDGLPSLGPVPGWQNLFVAAGHFRHGIQLSAGTGLLMKELLLGQKTTLDCSPFSMERIGIR